MFYHNMKLKQLRVVQDRIKKCTASIAVTKAPIADFVMAQRLNQYLVGIMRGDYDCIKVLNSCGLSAEEAFDYLEKLGNYFVNVAKYEKEKQIYDEELKKLRYEEYLLKKSLNIE